VRRRSMAAGLALLLALQAAAACAQPGAAGGPPAPAAAMRDDAEAARFAQDFYDWYGAYSRRATGAAWDSVEVRKPGVLDDALVAALRADAEARAEREGEIVGLDFDPFLNAQDPCERYEARGVERAGETYRVAMYGTCADAAGPTPDVVVELVRAGPAWRILNFHYPEGKADLLDVLRWMAGERANPTVSAPEP
jgi:hypothetical protein